MCSNLEEKSCANNTCGLFLVHIWNNERYMYMIDPFFSLVHVNWLRLTWMYLHRYTSRPRIFKQHPTIYYSDSTHAFFGYVYSTNACPWYVCFPRQISTWLVPHIRHQLGKNWAHFFRYLYVDHMFLANVLSTNVIILQCLTLILEA